MFIKEKRLQAGCVSCHSGNNLATGKDEAHVGLIVNPPGPGHK